MKRMDSEQDVLDDYMSRERVLTPGFVDGIEWEEIGDVDEGDLAKVAYFAQVEAAAGPHYHAWLRGTPSSRDPIVGSFLGRWAAEEATHGEVLSRFLEEAGYPVDWHYDSVVHPTRLNVQSLVVNLVGGEIFVPVHMVTGAIHERGASLGYRRLDEMVDNPVLHKLLKAIIKEEARHMGFYEAIARLRLMDLPDFKRRVVRWMVEKTLKPVGTGIGEEVRGDADASALLKDLFGGDVDEVRRFVDLKIAKLPGFEGFHGMSRVVREYVREMV